MIAFEELEMMPGWKLLILMFLLLSESFAQKSSAGPSLTIRIYLIVPCESKSASKQRIKANLRTDREYCMERTPTISQNDVQSAELLKHVDHPPAVGLMLYPAAAQRMLNATTKNIGGHMAVVVNGRVVSVPMIAAPFARAVIEGDLSQAQADDIVQTLSQRSH